MSVHLSYRDRIVNSQYIGKSEPLHVTQSSSSDIPDVGSQQEKKVPIHNSGAITPLQDRRISKTEAQFYKGLSNERRDSEKSINEETLEVVGKDFGKAEENISSIPSRPELYKLNSVNKTEYKTGDLYFVNDCSVQKQALINQLRDEHLSSLPPSRFICIRSPKDLDKYGLLHRVRIENGNVQKEIGHLFSDEPLTLVFDLSTMTPAEIARINDILQNPPTCNNQLLGEKVQRVIIADRDILTGKKDANPDLCRRLRQMTNKQPPTNIYNSKIDCEILKERITELSNTDSDALIVDFASDQNWYSQLFGSAELDEQGCIVFQEGALARVKENNQLILKNSPWNNDDFTAKLATVLREGGFEANDEWVELPANITMSREKVSERDLNEFKKKISKNSDQFNRELPFVCINRSIIEQLNTKYRLEGESTVKKTVKTDPLTNLVSGCQQLVITSELSDNEWLWLNTKVGELPEDKRPRLFSKLPEDLIINSNKTFQAIAGRNHDNAFLL